jgi:cobalt-zinc-cadmium efflux system membrane fusion protein
MEAKESAAAPTFMTRSLPRARQARIAGLIGIVLVGILILVWGSSRLFGRTPDTAPAAPPAPGTIKLSAAQMATVKVEPVTRADFRAEDSTDGKIALNGDRTTPVYSPYSGKVTRVLAAPGDTVAEGARLFGVEASEFVQAHDDLLNASAQLQLATATEQRRHALFEAKGGSLQDWQQSQADLAAAQNAMTAVRNRLRILGKSDADIDELEHLKHIDAVTYVRAPIAGVVTDRQVGPGQYIQAGAANPVYTVSDVRSVWLVANVREADAPLVHRGQPVDVQVLALPERVFHARLTYVAPTLDPSTRRLLVRAEIDNPDRVLKPEMFANFVIATGSEAPGIGVPESAIVREGTESRVWVETAPDTLALREIETGRRNRGLVEVTSGLTASDRVVTSGSLFIDRAARPD